MKKYLFFLVSLFLINACTQEGTTNPNSEQTTKVEEPKTIDQKNNPVEQVKNTTPKTPNKENRLPIREEMQNKLAQMHEHLMGQMEKQINPKDVKEYMKQSEMYMGLYGDSIAAEHIFSAAELALAVQDYDGALNYWRIVYQAYKRENHPKVPHAIFMVGYTYENVLDKKDLAKKMYKELLAKHPDHDLAKEVKRILSKIDKSPEELIKEFEKKRKTG